MVRPNLHPSDLSPALLESLEPRLMLSGQVYTSTDVDMIIPDLGTVYSELPVSGTVYPITDVNVSVDLMHAAASGLAVYLNAPDGTRVQLFTNIANNVNYIDITLDDEAPVHIDDAFDIFDWINGTFQPQGSLSDVDGHSANGTWTLEMTGTAVFNGGKLNAWSLEIDTPDTVAPTATWLSPAAGTTITTQATNLEVQFSEPVTGLDAADVSLSWLVGSEGVVGDPVDLGGNAWRWPISGLSDGIVIMSIEPDGIEDLSGNSFGGAGDIYTVDVTGPTVAITPVSPDPRTTSVDEIVITFSEPVELELHDLTLTRDFSGNLLVSDSLSSDDNITWTVGIGPDTEIGNYTLTVLDSVTDMVGLPLAAQVTETWTWGPDAPLVEAEPEWTMEAGANTISWAAAAGADEYQVQCDDDADFSSLDGDSGWITGLSHTFDGLVGGVTYYYRVRSRQNIEDDTAAWSQTTRSEFQQGVLESTEATGDGRVMLDRSEEWFPNYTGGSSHWDWAFEQTVLNVYYATRTGTLIGLGALVNASEPSPMQFVVYRGGSGMNDPYTRIATSTIGDSGTGDGVRGAAMSVGIEAGRYYLIGAAWDGWVGAAYGSPGTDPAFAEHVGAMAYEQYPAPASAIYGGAGESTSYSLFLDFVSEGDYVSPGTITSPIIAAPPEMTRWGRLEYSVGILPGTTLSVDVLDSAGAVLASSVANDTDLAALGITAAAIKLRGNLATSLPAFSPSLNQWSVGWVESTAVYAEGPWSAAESSTQWGSIAPTGVDLVAIADTGASDTDDLTNLNNAAVDRKLRFDVAGTVAEATVELYADGVLIGTATGVAGTTRVVTDGTTALAEGPRSVTARQTIEDRPQSGDSPAAMITVDITAPDAPTAPDLLAASDTGVSDSDDITKDNDPVFAIFSADACYAVYADGVLASGPLESAPTWALADLAEGTHAIAVASVDAAGNTSLPGPALSIEIDTVAPAPASAPDLQAGSDSGVSDTDNVTNLTTLTFDVTSTDAYFRFYIDSGLTFYGQSASVPSYTVTGLTEGTEYYHIVAEDAAGNLAPAGGVLVVTIDTTPPVVDVLQTVTVDPTPFLQGSINDPAATVEVTVDGRAYAAISGGFWLLPDNSIDPPLADGVYDVQVAATDMAGNVGYDTTTDELTIFTYGQIIGRVWHDLNADREAEGEPGLESWTVYLDLDGDGTLNGSEPMRLTGPNGGYVFDTIIPGEYALRSVIVAGWHQSTDDSPVSVPNGGVGQADDIGLYQLGELRGTLRYDGDDDGAINPADPPLADRVIYLDLNGNDVQDVDDMIATTADDGSYAFAGLTPGTYSVRMDDLSYGHVSFPATGGMDVVVPSGELVTDVDFAYHWPITEIHGKVYRDLGGNDVWDPGDPVLPGRKVYLDKNLNGAWDAFDPFAITDADGVYSIERVIPHTYTVRVANAWYETVVFPTEKSYALDMAAGDIETEKDFGYRWLTTEIRAVVWTDANDNGTRDPGENLEGWTVVLDLDQNGTQDAGDIVAVTDVDGQYVFDDFPPGDTAVMIIPQPHWAPEDPSNGQRMVAANLGQLAIADFRVTELGDITGRVWHDLNGDKELDPDESGLADWVVYSDSNGNNMMDVAGMNVSSSNAAGTAETGTVAIPLTVPLMRPSLLDVDVSISFHTDGIMSARIDLVSPAGTTVRLMDLPDRGDPYADPFDVTFDDDAISGLLDDPIGYSDRYRPDQPLAGFDYEAPDGTWLLLITAQGNGGNWMMPSATIHFKSTEPRAPTDAEGFYVLSDLRPTAHQIRVAAPEGWTPTLPPSGLSQVELPPGQTVENIDFAYLAGPAQISGQVFLETDWPNGVQDSNEPGVNGWTIELVDPATGAAIDSMITTWRNLDGDMTIDPFSEQGRYWFEDLMPGEYLIRHADAATLPHTTVPARMFALLNNNSIGRIDPISGQTMEIWSLPVHHTFVGIATGPGVLYGLSTHADPFAAEPTAQVAKIWQFDPVTMDVLGVDVLGRFDSTGESFNSLAYLDGKLFTLRTPALDRTRLLVWDTRTGALSGELDTAELLGPITGAADRGGLLAMAPGNILVLLDPATGAVLQQTQLPISGGLWNLSGYINGEVLAFRSQEPQRLYRIDPDSGGIVGEFTVNGDVTPSFAATDDVGGVQRVTVMAAEELWDVDFGTYTPTEICGQAFADLDNDGQRDDGEYGLNGVTIELRDSAGGGVLLATAITHYEDLDGDGRIDPMTEAGVYSFDNLSRDVYRVSELGLSEWARTWPDWTNWLQLETSDSAPFILDFGYYSSTRSVAPVAVDLLEISDIGISSTDDVTCLHNGDPEHALQFLVTGTVPEAEVGIYVGPTMIGWATGTAGTTIVTTEGGHILADGAYTIVAMQTEYGKSISDPSETMHLQVDATPPLPTTFGVASSTAAWGPGVIGSDQWDNGRPAPTISWAGMDRLAFDFSEVIHVSDGVVTVTGQATGEIAVTGITGIGSARLIVQLAAPLQADTYDVNWAVRVEDAAGAYEEPDGWVGGMLIQVVPGDVTGDGIVGREDYDAMVVAVSEANQAVLYDLNTDGVVDASDTAYLLTDVIRPPDGDATLDGSVDLDDFVVLKQNFSTGTEWVEGDFDGNGLVDLDDFVLLKKGFGGAVGPSVGGAESVDVLAAAPVLPAPSDDGIMWAEVAPRRRARPSRRRAAHVSPDPTDLLAMLMPLKRLR